MNYSIKAVVEAGQGPRGAGSISADKLRVAESEAPHADVGKGFSRRGSF